VQPCCEDAARGGALRSIPVDRSVGRNAEDIAQLQITGIDGVVACAARSEADDADDSTRRSRRHRRPS
jgi:hypothetical protein